LDIATFSAVLQFNDGGNGILEVFRKLGVRPGKCMRQGLSKAMTSRINLANTGCPRRLEKLENIYIL